MQRLSDKDVLKHTILSSISQAEAGPFAYAECFDKDTNKYLGIVIENGMNTSVALTNESVIIRPSVAENHRPETNKLTLQKLHLILSLYLQLILLKKIVKISQCFLKSSKEQ